MFALIDNPEFTHKVTVIMPVDGGTKKHTFKGRFKVLSTDEIAKLPVTSSFGDLNATFLRAVIVELSDLTDEKGEPLPYNDELRDRVLQSPPAQMALMRTYLDAISNVKQGN